LGSVEHLGQLEAARNLVNSSMGRTSTSKTSNTGKNTEIDRLRVRVYDASNTL
jgi:hypothetical protein